VNNSEDDGKAVFCAYALQIKPKTNLRIAACIVGRERSNLQLFGMLKMKALATQMLLFETRSNKD